MNHPGPTPRFCEQCGAVLEIGARFCEACGTKVADHPESPGQEPTGTAIKATSLASAATFPGWLKGIFIASALFAFLAITGASGWWIWKTRIVPVNAAAETPLPSLPPELTTTFTPPPSPVFAPVDENRIEQAEPPRESPPIAEIEDLADQPEEDPVFAWLETQPWFRRLGESMPPGVTLSVMTNEGDAAADGGWDTIEIRENHSPESGFDPNVSPLIGIFRVSADRASAEWLNAITGEWVAIEAFLRERMGSSAVGTTLPPNQTTTFLIYNGDFEGEARDGSPDPPVAVNDPLNPGNLAGLLESPEPLRLELAVDDASAAGGAPLTVALRFYLPQIARSRDESGVRLRLSLIGENGKMVHGDLKIQSSDTWQPGSVRFTNPPSPLYGVSLEVIGIDGAVFVDDLRFIQ